MPTNDFAVVFIMEKRVAIIFAIMIAVCCLLSGCGKDPVSTLPSGTVPATTDGSVNTTVSGTVEPTTVPAAKPVGTIDVSYGVDSFDNAGWEIAPNSQMYGAVVEDGYYYIQDEVFRYLDMNTGISVCLCSKPACKHNSEECEAFTVDPFTRQLMFFINDCLYYIELDNEGASLLMRRNSTGMELQRVARLGESLMGKDRSITIYQPMITENWLYYMVEIQGIVTVGEVSQLQWIGDALCRVNLTNGKEEVLVVTDGDWLQLITVRTDGMIYTVSETPDLEHVVGADGYLTMPDNYYDLLPACAVNLMRWDEGTGENTLLLERTRATLEAPKSYGGKVTFYTSDHKERWGYDLTTGEVTQLDLILGTIINEDYMLYKKNADPNVPYDLEGQFILNMKTGELFPIDIPGGAYWMYNRSDKWLIINSLVGDRGVLYYIPIDAIADGIQVHDATIFPTA